MDVGEAAPDGPTVSLRAHSLLLALAGRVDDSALTSAHELVARADVDEAVELVVGTLIAGRIPVRETERRELASILELSQCDPTLVDGLFVDELASAQTHRFAGEVSEHGSPDNGVGTAVERVTRVLPDVRTVHAVWRLTPAGAVPGALPTRVVLVEVGSEANPPAVAYRIDVALRRVSIDAVVEVLSPESGRSRYHESALNSARHVYADASPAESGGEPSGVRESTAPASTAPGPTSHGATSHGPTAPRVAPTRAQRRNHHAESPGHELPATPVTHEVTPDHHASGFPPETEKPVARESAPNTAPESIPERDRLDTTPWEPGSYSQFEVGGASEPAAATGATEVTGPVETTGSVETTGPTEPTGRVETTGPTETAASGESMGPADAAEHTELPGNSKPWQSAFVESAADQSAAAAPRYEPWEPEPAPEERVASTTEMTPAEMAQLRQALAEDPEKGRQIAASVRPGEVVEIPELDLNDPQLSERDRELLRELHAELAARERADAGNHGVNGSQGS